MSPAKSSNQDEETGQQRPAGQPPDVVVEHVAAPDAVGRLRRALDLLLRAAARAGAERGPPKDDDGDTENEG